MVMNPALLVSVLSALAAGVWSVWTWKEEQAKERQNKRDQMAALFVNSFMLATEELQARLYGILEGDDLAFYKKEYPGPHEFGSPLAIEILYRLAQYFGWGNRNYRHGPYTRDPRVIELIRQIGETFENRTRFPGDAFRFTFEERVSLGEAVVHYSRDVMGFIPTYHAITLHEFQQDINDNSGKYAQLYRSQAVQRMFAAIDRSYRPEELEGVERLAVLQNLMVDQINYLEDMEGFSVSSKKRRRARLRGAMAKALHELAAVATVVHQTPGRIRLKIPRLKTDDTYAFHLQSLLDTVDQVRSISISVNAASVVINFSPEIPVTKFAGRVTKTIEKGISAP